MTEILDVDLLAFERGDHSSRKAVIDGVRTSLQTGFVYARHDLSETLLDEAYDRLAAFFTLSPEEKQRSHVPGVAGQTGYTGLLVETAASSDHPDWKEMLNWGRAVPKGHPVRTKYPRSYPDPVLPEAEQPGISEILFRFHDSIQDLQRRILRIVAEGLGAHETFFDEMLVDGPTLTRAIRYPSMEEAPGSQHVWAGAHGDINLITALPRATAPGLQVMVEDDWVDAVAPPGHVIINTGMMLERITNGVLPTGMHRVVAAPGYSGERYSVVQFLHPTPWTILQPMPSCVTPEHPQRFSGISAGDALDLVLYEINLIEDARRVG